MNSLAEDVVLNTDLANKLIEEAVAKCLVAMGTEDRRPSDYDRSMFWELYKRIADEFVFDFAYFTEEHVPLRWSLVPLEYLCGIWHGYFRNEMAQLIKSNKNFADLVDGAIANPDNYFRFTERIDALLRWRYNILESTGGQELKTISLGKLKADDLIRVKSQFEELRRKAYEFPDPIERRSELKSINAAENKLINSKAVLEKIEKLIDAGKVEGMYMFRCGRYDRYPLDGYSVTGNSVEFTDEDGYFSCARESFDLPDADLAAMAETRKMSR